MTRDDFVAWEVRMGFSGHGGQAKAARALDLSTATVRIYENGRYTDGRAVQYPLTLRLAMTALALGLPPWPPAAELHRDARPDSPGTA